MIHTVFKNALKQLYDFLIPPTCAVCKKQIANTSHSNGLYHPPFTSTLCSECIPTAMPLELALPNCSADILSLNNICRKCREPIVDRLVPLHSEGNEEWIQLSSYKDSEVFCLPCSISPILPGEIFSIYPFETQIRRIILSLKYRGAYQLVPFLTQLTVGGCTGANLKESWDLVVPIPSSRKVVQHRGYCHLSLITRRFSGVTGVPVDPFAIRSTRHRQLQASLKMVERRANLFSAFSACERRVLGKRVLLFDDVITSGETARAAANALSEAGASSVDLLTICRSKYFQTNRLRLLNADVSLRGELNHRLDALLKLHIDRTSSPYL